MYHAVNAAATNLTKYPFLAVALVFTKSLFTTPPAVESAAAVEILPLIESAAFGESVIMLLPFAPVFLKRNSTPMLSYSINGSVITSASVATL